MANRFLGKKGQGMLESALVFIVAILLLGGIINIWIWGNTQIVKRQRSYNASRLAAGKTVNDVYTTQWPLAYRPETLREDKVVLGHPGDPR